MGVQKSTFDLGVPWEKAAGYAQAVQVGDTIYISGQLGHEADGTMVSPAPDGRQSVEHAVMKAQLTQAYRNARTILEHFGCTFDNVVEEVVFAIDIQAALAVMKEVRDEFYGADAKPQVANTTVGTTALAIPGQVVEVKFIARLG
ncbi:Rid family hydrolase [Catellatospora sp. NPDC049111]|jgi:enamine deaminase RidA (YjgF/YER057c/UK114 family)|uniref:Rid family hydrolase n=1 Tax=unclassified Catellatospora TaxID=2645785 RepID=UPI0033C82A13